MIRRSIATVGCVLFLFLAAIPASAKKNNVDVRLEYVPQQNVSQVQARLERAQRVTPVAFVLKDGRSGDAAVIGTRSDDRDREYDLAATGDVVAFVKKTLDGLLRDWGVQVDDAAEVRLELELSDYRVRETNQAVGAFYESDVELSGRLTRAGKILWSGSISGGASRYGRKFSNDNVNEVLSDALLQTFGDLLSSRSVQKAWPGPNDAAPAAHSTTPAAASVATASPEQPRLEVLEPERLLAELKRFEDNRFEDQTVVAYLRQKALSRPLNADDLSALKEAGIPEAVIRTVVSLPVR